MEKTIGQRARQLRIEKGIRQVFVAKKLGFKSNSSYTDIEKGRRNISAHKIPLLAEALGVDIEELFFDTKVRDTRKDNSA